MKETGYFAPKSVEETILLISQHGAKSRIISGSTDLLGQIKKRVAIPEFLINITGIPNLDYIKYDEVKGLSIGALVTVASVAKSPVIQSKFNILAQAAGRLGTPTIRNRATIAGNLCNAAPSADTAPALIVLEAKAKIAGPGEETIVPVEKLFTGPGETMVKSNQFLTEIQVPNPPSHSKGVYIKQTRRQGADLAIVGIAVLLIMEGNLVKDVRIALGAVAPTPIRARKAEEILKGKKLDDRLLDEASKAASSESKPISDTRSSAEYRRKLVTVLVKRAIKQAAA
jgi:CO/xanthine dehydrogenase FAD-binding subunit